MDADSAAIPSGIGSKDRPRRCRSFHAPCLRYLRNIVYDCIRQVRGIGGRAAETAARRLCALPANAAKRRESAEAWLRQRTRPQNPECPKMGAACRLGSGPLQMRVSE